LPNRIKASRFQDSSTVLFHLPVIEHVGQVAALETALNRTSTNQISPEGSLAVILTLNDYTLHATPRLVDICRAEAVDEIVIFKDPSKPPYLCSYPSQQKGFKKKPPIGGDYTFRTLA
jgi:hypothetical protein